MVHKVDLTGDYETTVYDAARRLLAEGVDPTEVVETRRNGILSMSGIIGELVKWRVAFPASGPRLVPYQSCSTARMTAETPSPVPFGPAQSRNSSPGRLTHAPKRFTRDKIQQAGRSVARNCGAEEETRPPNNKDA